jgi:hypothetical protein
MFDIDKGLKGSVIHHKPLNDLQLKRLLLIFDELHFTPPEDNIHFLEKGSICYRYQIEKDRKILYSLDGHELLKRYSHLKEPEVPEGSLAIASVIRLSKSDKHYPFDPIVLSDVLPYYKGKEFESNENRLFDKFEKAINKDYIKFINYKNTDFNLKNAISLKIAYDFDVTDNKLVELVKPLFLNEVTETPNMFIPSPSFPELAGFQYFPQLKYNSHFKDADSIRKYDYERQFFSIVGKVNKKLALTEKFDLIPVIINDSIHNFYQYKIQKSKNNNDENFNEAWDQTYNYKLMNLNNLLFKSSSIFVKNKQLSEISIPEILAYKERCISDLYKLRKGLFPEINNIIGTDIKSNDLTEINKLIGRKIIPELNKYQKLQNDILSKTLGTALNFTVSAGSNYLGFVQGLSPMLISALSGASPILTEKMLQLSGKLQDKKKRKYENTFSYFLNLSN